MAEKTSRSLPIENADLTRQLMGALNSNAKMIDKALATVSKEDADGIRVTGQPDQLELAIEIYRKLLVNLERGAVIDEQMIHYLLDAELTDHEASEGFSPDFIAVNAKGRPVFSKTRGQQEYITAIHNHDLTFAIGPAGTGKTYLAVALAVKAFRSKEVSRIILTRPAVEAGEKLGFLPGDLQMKVDPYMRPLYDALYDLMGPVQYNRNLEAGMIEVSPLAYMRGRTLDDAFIILDEAQNTTPEQMKMFLTRIGFNSRVVVTGDVTQIDLPNQVTSGLVKMPQILDNVEGVGFVRLQASDVVRNPLVKRIIAAYDQYDRSRALEVQENHEE